jgi:two-component system sensor histidine kinase KdpD
VGYVEPHVRPETQALVLGLDMLARREVDYRGTKLLDFDLEAALARRPQLILVDELAHTNAQGLTHAKRWQDVKRLLDAGIDVYTTLNVQHLESLNDVIAQITGVVVRETVPDSMFEQAHEVELVDIAPDDLIERLQEGKVYLPQQAERAIANYFQKGNLIALRELALRRMADRVDAQMEQYRSQHAVTRTWPAADRLLVCVGPSPMAARLVRSTSRMATSLRAPWVALHVETATNGRMSTEDSDRLATTLHLAEQLGGEIATVTGDNVAEAVLEYARSRNVTRIIVGKPQQPRWKEFLKGSYVYELTRRCGDIDVYVISGDQGPKATAPARISTPGQTKLEYLYALGTVAICTLIDYWFAPYFKLPNLIMVYLLGVVLVAARFGHGPAVLASVASVAAFDFFFVPPHLLSRCPMCSICSPLR